MKTKFFVVFAICFFIAGNALAFTVGDADNVEVQVQDLSGADYGLNGADSKYVGGQFEAGVTVTNGGFGLDYTHQAQGAHVNVLNSTATARHQYDIDTETRGASVSDNIATAGHVEMTATEAAISTTSNGVGTEMLSTSASDTAALTGVGATWDGAAVSMADTTARTEYEQINFGVSSSQYATGVTEVSVSAVSYTDIGSAGAAGTASSNGGTHMVNDGMGGAMASAGQSHSEVDTATAAVGASYSNVSAEAANTHYSEQAAYGYGTYQYQETVVATGAAE